MTLDRTGDPAEDMPEQHLPACICDDGTPGWRNYYGDVPEPCPRHKAKLLQRLREQRDPSGPITRRPEAERR